MNRTFAIIWIVLGMITTAGVIYLLHPRFDYANPEFLWGLLVLPLIGLSYILRLDKTYARLSNSSLSNLSSHEVPFKVWLRHLLFAVKLIGVGLLIFSLARPQKGRSPESNDEEGIDIVICLDVSGSMMHEDMKPTRLEVAKDVAMDFIDGRPDDRIGLVVFEAQCLTQAPLTRDHEILKLLFSEVESGMLSGGTAIGDALAKSVSRLVDSEADSKVVILLSDGENTSGERHPQEATEMAKEFGVRVHTISIGTNGYSRGQLGSDLFGNILRGLRPSTVDEGTLKSIAKETGGKFFTATSKDKMEKIYADIDEMERTEIEEDQYVKQDDKYYWFTLIALGLILLYHLVYDILFRILY